MANNSSKDKDPHIIALEQLCRVCGEKVKPAKKRRTLYKCTDHTIDLHKTFGIDVQHDKPSIHPQHFCQSCKGAIYHHKTKGEVLHSVVNWKCHNDEACETCARANRAKMGGRPSKINIGRPAVLSRRSLLSHVLHIAPPSHQCLQQGKHTPSNFTTPPHYAISLNELTRCICSSVLDQPIELTGCESLVCANCISKWLVECDDNFPCPCCHRKLNHLDKIKEASKVIQKLIAGIIITCSCGLLITNGSYAAHVKGECSTEMSTTMNIS